MTHSYEHAMHQNPETDTWAGPGQGERAQRSWTDGGTAYRDGYTYTPLGLAGRTTNTPSTPASSYYIRDPYGTPVAERNSDGTEYYYLFDGQGDVVALEDPGTVVGSYDYCPTGNEADLAGGTQLTQAALNQPLRQGARPLDDDLADYFGPDGAITENYSGVGTQVLGLLPLDPEDPTIIIDRLKQIVAAKAGFATGPYAGVPIVVDSNVADLAAPLRADQFNARSVPEIFGSDPGDPAITAFTGFIGGYVVTNNRKRELQPGGKSVAFQRASRSSSPMPS